MPDWLDAAKQEAGDWWDNVIVHAGQGQYQLDQEARDAFRLWADDDDEDDEVTDGAGA